MSAKKLKKEELKEDKVVIFMVKATKYIEDHIKQFIVGALVIVLLVAAGWLYNNYRSKMIAKANMALAEGDHLFEQEKYQEAINMYKQILNLSSIGHLKGVAYLKIANSQFALNSFGEAETNYKNSSKILKKGFLYLTTQEGIAQVYVAQNKFDEAAKIYEELANKSDVSTAKDRIARLLYLAAENYERAKNYEKAKSLYNNISTIYKDSVYKQKADKKLSVIEFLEKKS